MKTYVPPVTFFTRKRGKLRMNCNHSMNSWFGWKMLHRLHRIYRRKFNLQ